MPGRVSSRQEFAEFGRSPWKASSGPLRVVFVPSEDGIRGAYAISKRVGGAVVRNKIRRRLRSVLDESAKSIQPGKYLIRCGVETKGLSYDELRTHLLRALQRLESKSLSTYTRRGGSH